MIHYIYIPGFGERFDEARQKALRRWSDASTRVTFVPMYWNDRDEPYQKKFERIVEVIATASGDEIRLVGESAGGAMAVYSFLRLHDSVDAVITVCGYNHGAEGIGASVRVNHPAFYALVCAVDAEIAELSMDDRRRITTLYSRHDHVVRPKRSRIDGTSHRVLLTPGHFLSIASVLLKGPRKMKL